MDFRDPAEQQPVGALRKASSKRHALPVVVAVRWLAGAGSWSMTVCSTGESQASEYIRHPRHNLAASATLPVGAPGGDAHVGVGTSQSGRDYRFGYGIGVLEQGRVHFEVGAEA